MKLDLSTLENGLTEFGFAIPTSSFTSDMDIPEISQPVKCVVNVFRSGDKVLITGQFEAILRINCSRCLELAEYTLNAQFTSDFRQTQENPLVAGKIELTPDELDIVWYNGNEIDLTEQVRQQMVVNLPMQVLCKENCRGLCVKCGANLNIHPCQCPTEDDENPFRSLSGIRLS